MEYESARRLHDTIKNRNEQVKRRYPEQVRRYETGNWLSRWLIGRRYPLVAHRYAFIKAEESIPAAKLSAQQHESHIIIL